MEVPPNNLLKTKGRKPEPNESMKTKELAILLQSIDLKEFSCGIGCLAPNWLHVAGGKPGATPGPDRDGKWHPNQTAGRSPMKMGPK
jgi:hypothetical protein